MSKIIDIKRQKKERSTSISYDSLETVIKCADSIIEQYPDMTYSDFSIKSVQADYYDSEYPHLVYSIPETDKEMKSRIEQEAKSAVQREEWERKQFEALKKKFGP